MIKDEQIAYFNSLNAAIELVKGNVAGKTPSVIFKEIKHWRDAFFLEFKKNNNPHIAKNTIPTNGEQPF